MIIGRDFSAYQGSSLYPWLDDIDFAFVKVSEGQHTVDSGWEGRLSQVRAAGLVAGVYHYAHPENPVSGDAQHFISTYRSSLRSGDLIAVDVEMTGGYSASHVTAWKDQWIAAVQDAFPENLVGLYCNTNYWLHETTGNAGDFLWIASYGTSDPGIQYDWKIWQYTSSPVDTNKAKFSSRADMREWALSKSDGDNDGGGDDDGNAFPGAGYFGPGESNAYVTELGTMLIARGAGAFYSEGAGPTWTDVDGAAMAAFQTAQGWTGASADGIPGEQSWDLLVAGTGNDIPDPGHGYLPFPSTRWFEDAPNCWIITAMGQRLVAEGCSCYSSGPGAQWTEADRCSAEKWQRKLGYTGGAADGYFGVASWTELRVPGA
ncbi:peptidoglycan-binding protein [Streptomyces sp. NPDC102364]|uniref:peptidoglycan-binding protein n=1 Tax=Streptomyces sp. NPDC102364 TaxID=3366161 RepID=UPI00382B6F38